MSYEECSDQYAVLSSEIYCQFDMEQTSGPWLYLYVDFYSEDKKESFWDLKLLNSKNQVISEQKIILNEGTNEIILQTSKFHGIRFEAKNVEQMKFRLNNVELRRQGKDFLVKKFFLVWVFAFITLFFSVEIFNRTLPIDKCIILWQESGKHADSFLKELGKNISWRFSTKTKRVLRSGLFLIMLLYMTFFQIRGPVVMQQYKSMHMWAMGSMLFILAGLCYEDRSPKRYGCLLKKVTSLFVIVILVSDFCILKRYRYAGFGMLFMGGIFLMAWERMECPEKLLEEFKWAYKIYFVAGLVFCIIARPCAHGVCYNGFLTDPISYGTVMLIAATVFLDDYVKDNKKIFCEIGAVVSVYLVWKTQQIMLIIIMGLLLVIGALFWIGRLGRMDLKSKVKNMILSLIGAMAGIAFVLLLQIILYRVPYLIGTSKVFEADITEILDVTVLNSLQEFGWKHYFLDKILNCNVYLQRINLLGHKSVLTIHGISQWADNSIVMNLYWYGMIAGITYGIMVFLYFINAVRISVKLRDILSVGLPLICVSVSMTEAMEAPFSNLSWYLFYLGLCYVIVEQERRAAY